SRPLAHPVKRQVLLHKSAQGETALLRALFQQPADTTMQLARNPSPDLFCPIRKDALAHTQLLGGLGLQLCGTRTRRIVDLVLFLAESFYTTFCTRANPLSAVLLHDPAGRANPLSTVLLHNPDGRLSHTSRVRPDEKQ